MLHLDSELHEISIVVIEPALTAIPKDPRELSAPDEIRTLPRNWVTYHQKLGT